MTGTTLNWMGGGSKSYIQTPECCLPLLNPYFLLQQCWVHLILINLLVLLLVQCVWYTIRNLSRVGKKCRHCQSRPGLQMGGVGWGSTHWWIFLWPWLDVPSCSLFFISHNTYSCMLCCILSFAVCLCLQWELALMLFLQFLPSYLEGHLPAQPLFLLSLNYCCCTREAQGHAGDSQSDKAS